VLSGLCGEILLENGIGFHEVSYKRFKVQRFMVTQIGIQVTSWMFEKSRKLLSE
jgi:hypothetical protein